MIFFSFLLLCVLIIFSFMIFPKFYAYFKHYLFNKKMIVLYDMDGKQYYTNERILFNNTRAAYVYPFAKIGYVILLEDNKTHQGLGSTYIKSWYYYK